MSVTIITHLFHRFILQMYCIYTGFNGGYGSAGLGLGPRYGNGGMKGPQRGRNEFFYISFSDLHS